VHIYQTYLRHIRHQIVRLLRALTDRAGRVRADRIEVAQNHDAHRRFGGRHVLQNVLDHALGLAVCDCTKHKNTTEKSNTWPQPTMARMHTILENKKAQ
jgi:hypothetical protein